ncbi:MAG: lipocalin family protein [Limisphaerales bacterium]
MNALMCVVSGLGENISRHVWPKWLFAVAAVTLAGCATPQKPVSTVPHVDLNRYLGRWYVIANIPYFLENGKVASYDTYALRTDGRMDNIFTFRKGTFDAPEDSWHGVAWVVNHESNAEWKVRFIWPFTATYLVLELDPEYQWAVVGTPNRKLLWVLSRQRQLSETTYSEILRRIAEQGYDTNILAKVPQAGRKSTLKLVVFHVSVFMFEKRINPC